MRFRQQRVITNLDAEKNFLQAETELTSQASDISSLLNRPRVRVHRGSTQSLTDLTRTAILWDTEDYDTDSMHSTSSNTDRLVIPEDGVYELKCAAAFASGTGNRYLDVCLNGTSTVLNRSSSTATSGVTYGAFIGWEDELAAGAYLVVVALQGSGGSLNLNADQTWATLRRVA